MQHSNLTEIIIGAAYTVHNTLGTGYLEKVYENALIVELRKQGLYVQAQLAISVHYCDVLVGDFIADLLIEGCVLIELKAVDLLHTRHEAQLVNYLVATGIDVGLLINFGNSVAVKRKYRTALSA